MHASAMKAYLFGKVHKPEPGGATPKNVKSCAVWRRRPGRKTAACGLLPAGKGFGVRLAISVLLGVLLVPLLPGWAAWSAEDLAGPALAGLARAAFYDQAWAETERLSQLGLDAAAKEFGPDSPEA